MSSNSQARDIDDVTTDGTAGDLLNVLNDPTIYWGPTLAKPLRGRSGEELEILQKSGCTGICHLCEHLLVRRGNEWRCNEVRCKIAHSMMGCIPKRGGWNDKEPEEIEETEEE